VSIIKAKRRVTMKKKVLLVILVAIIGSAVLSIPILAAGQKQAEYDIFVGEGLPTFVAATSWGVPPFVWVDGKGHFVGFDADVLRSIAIIEKFNLGVPLDIDFAGLIPALVAGKYDIFFGFITITEERAKIIDYTDPYWESDYLTLVRKDSELNGVTALCCGSKVGMQGGTTPHIIAQKLAERGTGVVPAVYDRFILSLMDLLKGRIDAILVDTPFGNQYLKKHPNELKKVGMLFTGELTGMAVRKGDPKGILPRLNRGFKRLKNKGIWDHLVNAYMTGDLEKITDGFSKCGHLLLEKKDPLAYAKKLEELMTTGAN
jgi:polar amino acid transport system substrate-binding protein